jgi:hypothetical protein
VWHELTGLNVEILDALIDSARNSAKTLSSKSGKIRDRSQEVREWMTWVARNGVTDHEKLPGRKDFDSVQAQRAISAEHRQAAQLFFLTVLESELKKAAKTDPSGEYSTVGRGME